ncbi:hypothetical protein ABFS82_04G185300 [Erythranthe guttata]
MEMKEQIIIRKGPWTEQEDAQLVFYVNLFGDRRWDFIAKVSGLKRTGKSCRLRWVNYLHPGLKRGKMTTHEEKLVLELHNKWGNRWSRIARKIPGRTDNEIKNYWRTHMRKKAQDQKKTKRMISPSLSSSSSSSFSNSSTSSISNNSRPNAGPTVDSSSRANTAGEKEEEISTKVYSMDEIWKDIELSEESSNFKCQEMISHTWDMLMQPIGDDNFHSLPFYNHI